MRIASIIAATAAGLALVIPSPASAQAWIGQIIPSMQGGSMDGCYDPGRPQKDRFIRHSIKYVDRAMAEYVTAAASGASLEPLFKGKPELLHFRIDGVESNIRSAKDPWITASTRFVPVEYRHANIIGGAFASRWNLVDATGNVLGNYEIWMQPLARRFAFIEINLHSKASPAALQPITPYCALPGDIAKWQEAKKQRDAEKAAKAKR